MAGVSYFRDFQSLAREYRCENTVKKWYKYIRRNNMLPFCICGGVVEVGLVGLIVMLYRKVKHKFFHMKKRHAHRSKCSLCKKAIKHVVATNNRDYWMHIEHPNTKRCPVILLA